MLQCMLVCWTSVFLFQSGRSLCFRSSRCCLCAQEVFGPAELLGQWISGMHKGYDKFYALPKRPSAQTSSAVEQLCTYIQHAITAALMLGQHTQTMTPLQQNTLSVRMKSSSAQQGQAASGLVQVDTPSQSSHAVQSASPPMQTLASHILDFVAAAASSEAVQATALLHLLKLAQSLVDAMQQQQCEAAPKQVELLMDCNSAVGKLRCGALNSQCVAFMDKCVWLPTVRPWCSQRHDGALGTCNILCVYILVTKAGIILQ